MVLTAEALADAFDAMWNAALGVSHERQEGTAVASMLAEGFAAMGRSLRDQAKEHQTRSDPAMSDTSIATQTDQTLAQNARALAKELETYIRELAVRGFAPDLNVAVEQVDSCDGFNTPTSDGLRVALSFVKKVTL